RPRAFVAGGVAGRALGQLCLAADPVHDLEPPFLGLRELREEVEEVVRLPVEAARVEPPEHERRVADPREAVIPIALAVRRFGERRRRRRNERARRLVTESLERERAALEERAPRVVRELAVVEPMLRV